MGTVLATLSNATLVGLCLSFLVWSKTPSFTHSSIVFETIHKHLEMIAGRVYSRGFHEDIYWAMHVHTHEATDHDYGHVFLLAVHNSEPLMTLGEAKRRVASVNGPCKRFRIERPPHA
ncbi:MAG: hypothetical protein QNI90_14030 [Dinoroseobacter sp.]|nr:hypothetical protein [Dinoroseobacter sp.]